MINLESQNQALKTTWIPKLLQINGVWKSYVTNKIPVDIKYADLPFKFLSGSMWNEVLLNWCLENYSQNIDTVEQILNQNIWYNSHFRRDKKPVYLKQWEKKA